MQPYKQFIKFIVEDTAPETFTMQRATSHAVALSAHYAWTIEVRCVEPITCETLLNRPARLQFHTPSGISTVVGVIDTVSCRLAANTRRLYMIHLVSPLRILDTTQQTRVFVNLTVKAILSEILKALHGVTVEFRLRQTLHKFPLIMQYKETDLAFMQRILEEIHGYFFITSQDQHGQLVITDHFNTKRTPLCLRDRQRSGTCHDEASYWRLDAVLPDLSYVLHSNAMHCRLGQAIRLEDPMTKQESLYWIMKTEHQIIAPNTYMQKSTLIQTHTIPQLSHPPRELITGLLPARIVSGPCAQGTYRVKFQCDQNTKNKDCPSSAMPYLNTYGNAEHGLQLPLRQDTHVAIGFVQGDRRQPYIAGVLPQTDHRGLVNQDNPTQHRFQSAQGHGLCLDDHPQHPAITLKTADQQTVLTLETQMKCYAKNGAVCLTAGNNLASHTAKHLIHHARGTYQVHVTGDYTLKIAEQGIQYQAGRQIKITVKRDFHCTSQETLRLNTHATHKIHAKKSLEYKTTQGLLFRIPQGDFVIPKAKTITLQNPTKYQQRIGTKKSNLTLCSDRIHCKAREITIKAQHIVFPTATVMNEGI